MRQSRYESIMAGCVIACVWQERDGVEKPVASVTFDEPSNNGDTTLPVTTMLDRFGFEIDWESCTPADPNPNPLRKAVVVVAGPDSQGKWHTIDVLSEFSRMN